MKDKPVLNYTQSIIDGKNKRFVIAVTGRAVGKTTYGILKAKNDKGALVVHHKNIKYDLVKEYQYGDIYTYQEFFEAGRRFDNKTVIFDEFDLMKLSNEQIRSIIYGYDFNKLIILGTPISMDADVEPYYLRDQVKLEVKYRSPILQLYFNLKDDQRYDCLIIPSSKEFAGLAKNDVTIKEYKREFLLPLN